jgi:hypothetical protein
VCELSASSTQSAKAASQRRIIGSCASIWKSATAIVAVIDTSALTFVVNQRRGDLVGVTGDLLQIIKDVLEIGARIGSWTVLSTSYFRV